MTVRRPSLSLRARVAVVSALAAAIVIAAIGVAFAVFLRSTAPSSSTAPSIRYR